MTSSMTNIALTEREPLTYFDNSATSFPKPVAVAQAMTRYLLEEGGSYGRSSHARAFRASAVVEDCRERLAQLMDIAQVEHLCFANNATHAANVILQGLDFTMSEASAKAEVLISPLEHNAIARPLAKLEESGLITVRHLPAGTDGVVQPEQIASLLTDSTRLIVVNHQSNVNGAIQPLAQIKQVIGRIPLLADVSQSLGKVPVCVDEWGIDYLIFTGHKGLFGPPGTGGLFIRQPANVQPLHLGGTGSNSEHLAMPETMPDRFEAGTPNMVGIYGLLAALENKPEPQHSRSDFFALLDAIESLPGYRIQRTENRDNQGDVISLLHDTIDSATLSWQLEKEFGIETRPGLHCAPLAHKYLHSFPGGTCRLSPSLLHTTADFDYLVTALASITRGESL